MKTNKLIIYAAIGVGLWLLFRRKNSGKPEAVHGIQPEMINGHWMYPVPSLVDGKTHYMTYDDAVSYYQRVTDEKLY